jgi:glycosyltransferase involved in cell wall biosynthesis
MHQIESSEAHTAAASPGDSRVSLSILVPVCNERYLVAEALRRLDVMADDPYLSSVEVIVVDDGSTDGTNQVLDSFETARRKRQPASSVAFEWHFIRHDKNEGKGKAIQTALAHATGQVCVIYDADLEYHPKDISRLIKALVENSADAVFGSRFAGSEVRRVLLYRHQLVNKFLTFLCNLVSNLNLTDVWTCYKAIRTNLLRSIPIVSNDFRIEPELTIKLSKRGARIFEVPISYFGRTYAEGKKIGVKDALLALCAVIRFGISDNVYCADEHGSQVLARLSRARRFNTWMVDTIRPYCGDHVLEIGSGIGNLSCTLVPRLRYVATDVNPLYLHTLENLAIDRPYFSASYCDVTNLASYPRIAAEFDTVICLNVLEHVDDDCQALLNIRSVLGECGRAIVLVPQGPWNFGSVDSVLGHRRRYTVSSLAQLAASCGMKITELLQFNRVGSIAWFINGKLLRRRNFGFGQTLMLNVLTPLMRLADQVLPVPPLSLIAVMVKSAGADSLAEGRLATDGGGPLFSAAVAPRADAADNTNLNAPPR